MTWAEAATLATVAAAGGAMNAVAGGGTLLTFPTLLFFGTPAIAANATSTLALVIGTSGSLVGYRRHFSRIKHWLIQFVPVSFVGGFLGSVLLTRTPNKVFARLVPFLILFATLLFLLQHVVRQRLRSENSAHPFRIRTAVIFQFFVAIYGGYFGAGMGILMLASLGFIGLTNIHEMNALKTLLAALINCVAALYFIAAGLIDWPQAACMTLGAMAGYFLGAHYAQQIPQVWVRRLITTIGFLLAAVTFYQQFIRARH